MNVNVVSLLRAAPRARDWSNQELAEFYRVENLLIRAGISVETDRGVSDEGDPWFVFCHAETGDIIIHFARFDGSYAVASPAFDRCMRGADFRSLIEALIATHPLAIAKVNGDAKISIHPAALMVAVVMTCFFKLAQTQAFASQFGAGEAQTDLAAGVDHDAAVKSGSVMVDDRHSQMLLTAIAFAVAWADSGAADSTLSAGPGAADVAQPMVFIPHVENVDAGLDPLDNSGLPFEHLGQSADHAQPVLGVLSFGDVAAAPSGDWGHFHAMLQTPSIAAFDNALFDKVPIRSLYEADTAKVAAQSADQGAGSLIWLPAMVNVALGAKGAIGTASPPATTNTPESLQEINNVLGNQVPGVQVSGVQTVNIQAAPSSSGSLGQAIQGNFTASGPEGDWAGVALLAVAGVPVLAVASGDNIHGADNLTVDPTTAVQVWDALTGATTSALTVNGGSTVAINETNGTSTNGGGITVNGGAGTTAVNVTQTASVAANNGTVLIQDAGWAAGIGGSNTAGTITSVTLDGLNNKDALLTPAATIDDNALANLTVVDTTAASWVNITDNLATPTATTLNLHVNDAATLTIADTNKEITTLNLSEVNSASTMTFNDNGLAKVTVPGGADTGTGVLTATINDNVASQVVFDFSGSNAADNITVDRTGAGAGLMSNDTYTLGNGGTAGNPETLTITYTDNTTVNTDTINFGSGLNNISDAAHTTGVHNYVNTAPSGLASGNTTPVFTTITHSATGAGNYDTLTFKGDTGLLAVDGTVHVGVGATVAAGIAFALADVGAHGVAAFTLTGSPNTTYLFDHAESSSTLTAADSLVAVTNGLAHLSGISLVSGVVHLFV